MGDPIIKVSAILEKIDMPYCLIGGYAVAAYGAPRYTAEVNFLVSRLKIIVGISKLIYKKKIFLSSSPGPTC